MYIHNQKRWCMTLKLGHKRHCSFCLALSWITHSRGSQPPSCEGTQAALARGPRGEDMQPPANSQPPQAIHGREPIWKKILQPHSSFQMATAPVSVLTPTS